MTALSVTHSGFTAFSIESITTGQNKLSISWAVTVCLQNKSNKHQLLRVGKCVLKTAQVVKSKAFFSYWWNLQNTGLNSMKRK